MFAHPVSLLPGLSLCLAIAAAAAALRTASGLSFLNPVILALAAGLLLRTVIGPVAAFQAGIAFAAKPLLRLAVVLLGL